VYVGGLYFEVFGEFVEDWGMVEGEGEVLLCLGDVLLEFLDLLWWLDYLVFVMEVVVYFVLYCWYVEG